MNKEMLIDAIGAVREDYLERSEQDSVRKLQSQPEEELLQGKSKQKRVLHFASKWQILATCACLLLAVGTVGFGLLMRYGGFGSSGNAGAGGSGSDDGSSVFMSYAGPVFPMTSTEGGEELLVERNITYDFLPWVPEWYSNEQRLEELQAEVPNLTAKELAAAAADYAEWYPEGGYYRSSGDVLVQDSYILTNPTEEEKEVTLLYPFVSSVRNLEENRPVLLDGTEEKGTALEATLHIGSYSGGFKGVDGSADAAALLNVEEITCWEEYKELLSDGTYEEHSLYYKADVSDIPVVVYRFTEEYGPEASDDMPNPTLRAMFEMDFNKTEILSYGFNGGYRDSDKGLAGLQYSIRKEGNIDYGKPCFILVLGEDVKNMEVTGYVTGGWDTKEVIADTGVTVTREETDLDTVLREIVALEHEQITGYQEGARVDFETYYCLFVDMLETYGRLSETPIARYEDGMLEFMDVYGVKRVCYLETRVRVPAGESITITASMHKKPSYDYYCAHTENQGISGYDMVTRLGTNLQIKATAAHIEDRDMVEIVRQNFGFDLSAGVKSVSLDGEVEHYYLEVRTKAEEE